MKVSRKRCDSLCVFSVFCLFYSSASLPGLDVIYGPVAEVSSEASEGAVSEFNSFVVAQFEVQRNTIEISYNIPIEGMCLSTNLCCVLLSNFVV